MVAATKNPFNVVTQDPASYILQPNSRARISWDLFGLMLLTHDLLMIPMQAFEKGSTGLPKDYDPNFTTMWDYVSACFWTFDMVVSFFTGYHSTEGFVVLSPRLIARKYLSSWFALDTSIVLSDWATLFITSTGLFEAGYLRLGKIAARVLRSLRLLRLMKMGNFMKDAIERINSEYLLTFAGLTKLVLIIVILNHYIACAWYALSQTGHERNWADKFLGHTDSIAMAYTTALHWSLTQFTPASMEVVPQNADERIFNSLVIIMAMVTFSSFVSSITNAMTHIRSINARKTQQDSLIRKYFAENKISHGVASSVWRYLKMNASASDRLVKEEDIPILKTLPERIRDQLLVEVYLPILAVHPALDVYFSLDAKAMLEVTKKCLSMGTMRPGQELCADYLKITKMIFIVHGKAIYNYIQDGIGIKSSDVLASTPPTEFRGRATTGDSSFGAHTPSTSGQRRGKRASGLTVKTNASDKFDKIGTTGTHQSYKSGDTSNGRHSVAYNSEDLIEAVPMSDICLERISWACEAALWAARARLEGPIVAAAEGCEVMQISAIDFQAAANLHPASMPYLTAYACLYVNGLNEATKDAECPDLLFNDHYRVQEFANIAWETCGLEEEAAPRLTHDALLKKLFDGHNNQRTSQRNSRLSHDSSMEGPIRNSQAAQGHQKTDTATG